MKRWLLPGTLAASALLGGWAVHAATTDTTTGRKRVTNQELLGRLQALLENERRLGFQKIDCRVYYEAGYRGRNACYGSTLDTQELVTLLQRAVDPLAYSGGWRNDYGVWGSFYELRDAMRQTFGITVNPVKGDFELEAIKEIRPFKNFVTVTVDQPR